MTASPHAHLSTLFERALGLPRDRRTTFLDEACEGDDALRRELSSLLLAHDSASGYFDDLAEQVVAPALSGIRGGLDRTVAAGVLERIRSELAGVYDIDRELSGGGMSRVFVAEELRLKRTVVIKVLSPELLAGFSGERFRREIEFAAQLQHPHIVPLLTADSTPSLLYYTMPFVAGESLRQRLTREGALPVSDALRIWRDVLDALDYAHASGVVHRDIKPANILLDARNAQVTDFGIARALAAAAGDVRATGAGLAIGTPAYMAPEQVTGEPNADHRVDVYAAGLVMYEMLAGNPPFEALSTRELLLAHLTRDPPPLMRLDAPTGLAALVLRCLEKNPAGRPQTVAAILGELEALPITGRTAARRAPTRRLRYGVAGLTVGAAGIAALLLLQPRIESTIPVMAVGSVGSPGGRDTSAEAMALPELLATNLARVPSFRIVARGRVFEMLAQLGVPLESPGSLSSAMRRAGATEAIEGVLYRDAGRGLRLDVRRVDLTSGLVRQSYTVHASDAFELADRATYELAAAFGLRAPPGPISAVTTKSLSALRLYEEGLRAGHTGDGPTARRLYLAALEEDSTFAMAAYLAAMSMPQGRMYADEYNALIARAVRLSGNAAERDRFAIRYLGAISLGETRTAAAYAESLAVRFPDDPASHLAAGTMLAMVDFDVPRANQRFQRAIDLDSMSLAARRGRCLACDGLGALFTAHASVDSFAAAERVTRWWLSRQPHSSGALWRLAIALRAQGRYDEAEAAIANAMDSQPGSVEPLFEAAFTAMYREDYEEADRLLAVRMRSQTLERQQNTRWWQIISLRNQGRLDEAFALAGVYERLLAPTESFSADSVAAAQVLFELGRHGEAATRFLSLARGAASKSRRFPGLAARYQAWFLTHTASALARARDTARMTGLADTIRYFGDRSGTVRDQRLHHHVRGLLLLARGHLDSSAKEFTRAMGSPVYGYTRTNLELGKVLIQLGRSHEAIPVLRAGLHGTIETNNYYVTRTELHEALAHAYDAMNARDSAAAEYRVVAKSWSRGDPTFRARARMARERAVALTN